MSLLAVPQRSADDIKDVKGFVKSIITVAYGDAASSVCLKDAAAFASLRKQVLELKFTSDTEASEAQMVLLPYYVALTRLQPLIGAELREQQTLTFTWKSAFDSDKAKVCDLRWELC